jgi:signal transduction histidine kinase
MTSTISAFDTSLDSMESWPEVQPSRHSDLSKGTSEFLAMVLHDLRNSLTVILATVELWRESARTQPPEDWAAVETAGHQALHLCGDLMDVCATSHPAFRLEPSVVDLNQVAIQAARRWQRRFGSAGIRFTCDCDTPAPHVFVMADPRRLDTILENLLGNALKYTPAGGTAQLQLRNSRQEAILSVRDTGIGIEPPTLAYLFQPYTRAKNGVARAPGTGLGLYLVRTLVELHGGTIEAHSRGLGSGSEFVLRLPLAKASLIC